MRGGRFSEHVRNFFFQRQISYRRRAKQLLFQNEFLKAKAMEALGGGEEV
jgi:hypothetical protein